MVRCTGFAVPFVVAALLPAQDPILAQLPADTTNLVVVRDPLPHVNALLGSPLVRRVLAESGELQQELFGRRFEPTSVRALIAQFASFVPSGLVIAAPDAATPTLLRAAQLGVAIALLGMMDRGAEGQRALVEGLRQDAEAALAAIDRLDLFARVEWRDVRTAERWFDDAVTIVEQLQGQPGIELKVEDAAMTVRVRPRQVLDGQLIERLVQLGIRVPEAWNPTFVASLTQDERSLVLRIGVPAAGPLAAGRLGRLWQGDAAQFLFVRAHVGSGADVFDALDERLAAVQEAGIAAVTPIAIRLQVLLSRFAELQDATCTTWRIGEGFTAVTESDLGEDVDDLDVPAPAVVKCIDAPAGPFVLSALPLDLYLAFGMDAIEEQLASRRGMLLPQELKTAREFLFEEESSVFEPGTLMVLRPAQFRGARDWQHGAMPFVAAALVAVADDAEAAAHFIAKLSAHLCEGVELEKIWAEKDVGLGVPTRVLDLAAVAPALAAMQLDCDFLLHWFTVDAVLVVSSDPSVSKELIARLRGDGAPKLPAGRLVDWTEWRSEHLVAAWAGIARWAEVLGAKHQDARMALRVLAALAPVVDAVNAIEWVTTIDGSIVRGVTTLQLRAPK